MASGPAQRGLSDYSLGFNRFIETETQEPTGDNLKLAVSKSTR